jgi:protease I
VLKPQANLLKKEAVKMKNVMFLVLFVFVFEAMSNAASVKVAIVIAHQNFREELFVTKQTLEKREVEVVVASSALTPAKGMFGGSYRPDVLLKDVDINDYEALIFVGGMGATEYWDNKTAHNLVKSALEKNKIIAAICIAPITLARAGILKGKKATVWPSEAHQLKVEGAIYTDNAVERDGLIITANGPQAAKEFGKTILTALGLEGF